jgi:hypothetical protein
MVAITVDLKTKGLALRPGASLQCRAFMKFRGPKALNDKLPVPRLELSRWRGGRFACYAPHVMSQRSASHCDPRTCSFSKYRKTNILQMSEKIEFP